ncbi:MAG: universal stress protein [Pseudomonadota bacterium]
MGAKKILFATRFEESAYRALESLVDLKTAGLEEIVLTYVIPREDVAFVPYGGYMKDEEERLREQARIRFEDWQAALNRAGVRSKIRIEEGEIIPTLMKIAEEERIDFIVAGRKKRSKTETVYVGSHMIDLLRRTPVPVLVSKYSVYCDAAEACIEKINEHPFERPLLATDWSEPSQNALNLAKALKGAIKRLEVAHVIGVKISKNLDKTELGRLESESRERLDQWRRHLTDAGIDCRTHLAAGRTTSEIMRLCRDLECTMTILGTTGKDRVRALFLGSVSQRIAEASEVPTLLVP